MSGEGTTSIRDLMAEGRVALSSWLSSPHALLHEAFHGAGFDCASIDMQHGAHAPGEVRDGIALAVRCGQPVLVRVPVGALDLASWSLDMGASGIIMPMIESVADAKAFVKAVKYPPNGLRSYGPTRAAALLSAGDAAAYVASADTTTLAFAMIETRTAMDAVEDIAAIDGLDGLFVGPSDLSIALSDDHKADQRGARVEEASARIVAVAKATGTIPGIYARTAEDARHYAEMGFRYICVSSDLAVASEGARRLAETARL